MSRGGELRASRYDVAVARAEQAGRGAVRSIAIRRRRGGARPSCAAPHRDDRARSSGSTPGALALQALRRRRWPMRHRARCRAASVVAPPTRRAGDRRCRSAPSDDVDGERRRRRGRGGRRRSSCRSAGCRRRRRPRGRRRPVSSGDLATADCRTWSLAATSHDATSATLWLTSSRPADEEVAAGRCARRERGRRTGRRCARAASIRALVQLPARGDVERADGVSSDVARMRSAAGRRR